MSIAESSSLVYLLTASKPGETTALEAVVDELTGVFSSFHGRRLDGMGTTIKAVVVCVVTRYRGRYIRWCKGVPVVSSWLQA